MPISSSTSPDSGVSSKSSRSQIPQHLAVIMDGNGRWAQSRGKTRLEGHQEGAKAVRRTVEACVDQGIQYLTVYAFSSENWKRSDIEVKGLLSLLGHYLKSELAELHKNDVRVKIIGDRSAFSKSLQKLFESAEKTTENNTKLTFQIALNYGARWDITQAAKALAQEVAQGTLNPEKIDAPLLESKLSTAGLPDPDLLIRTSGEQRLSNFLLWQLSYAEIYFEPSYWPDFTSETLKKILDFFAQRNRRFGGV
ncbi:MAG: isoprenyl transferase [bacterium]|nr:isoprenyl transferase [bacterium]